MNPSIQSLIYMDECYRYGSSHGCDGNCPVLLRGDCTIPDEVIFGEYKGKPLIDDLDLFEDLKDLYNLEPRLMRKDRKPLITWVK